MYLYSPPHLYSEGDYVQSSDFHGTVELGSCHHVHSLHPDTNRTRFYQLIATEARQSYPPSYSGTVGRGKSLQTLISEMLNVHGWLKTVRFWMSFYVRQVILATGVSYGAMLNERFELPIINNLGGIPLGLW